MADERARLPGGAQRKFIEIAIDRAGGLEHVVQLLQCSPRTVRDWRREKFLASYEAITKLAHEYSIPLPADIKIEEGFWYVTKGARRGGVASYQKQNGVIGDPAVRKQKWREWWNREGKAKMPPSFCPLPFTCPKKSVELAEFVGIMMGDGGMTERQLTITLHHINDLEYSYFVSKLIKKLFGVTPIVRHVETKSVNIILVSRSLLMIYLHKLGLPFGNKVKQNFDIPSWVKESPDYMIACIRGLVDTDGSVFTHRYRVNGKLYRYKKLSFCSASPPLRTTVMAFLREHEFHVHLSRGIDIRIESREGMARYMGLIGSHNPKHLKRYMD